MHNALDLCAAASYSRKGMGYGSDAYYPAPIPEGSITSRNNFLKHPSEVLCNLHGVTITFKVPTYHTHVRLILASQSFAIEKTFGLPYIVPPKKDMRHRGLSDKSKDHGITMSREIYPLLPGQTLEINRTSTWSVFGSNNLKTFAQSKGHKLWDWVTEWHTYSHEKKIKIYDEECCHEMNCFIKSHDG